MLTRDVGGLSFDADSYTVKRSLLREEYWVEDPDGERLLATERAVAEGKATYEFRDVADGDADDVVFSVHSQNTYDGSYFGAPVEFAWTRLTPVDREGLINQCAQQGLTISKQGKVTPAP